jgi:hypothetical protein
MNRILILLLLNVLHDMYPSRRRDTIPKIVTGKYTEEKKCQAFCGEASRLVIGIPVRQIGPRNPDFLVYVFFLIYARTIILYLS